MDFLVYSRAALVAGDSADNPGLDEQHWSYMDAFADGMAARGPTLGPDRQTWTGSLHVLDLPSPNAAREFVDGEPYNQAGLFAQHHIWRFTNLLGRTMWQFALAADEPRYLVLALGTERRAKVSTPVPIDAQAPELRERLIMYGALRHLDDDQPMGMALAVQAPARHELDALLADGFAGRAEEGDLEIHDWVFGGRR